MTIYEFSAQVLSRSNGQSSVASAAYRSGERLLDERTGQTTFYKRYLQPETMIISPSHAPEWVHDRNRLWNEAEKSETRKNSQIAREIKVSLPTELSAEQQTDLIKDYVHTQFVYNGMIADIAIHREDPKNPHAHILMTTREISKQGFTVKNRDWNDRALLVRWREQWTIHSNRALKKGH
ncbi:MobQ family relaxase [Jeotgalibacillus sp. ET6]|uniref:MobQ family relaxase n=1 Tax=Jeotgalibacillus sp. ET6 TaxID=3037260 RepID=UPI0024182A44|nr:MobQ family relaxase [Jeotgalibacillus sp. ET6]MDG5473702.1 MobQ family relaxase [Jeotgalibacillus sp. ET6]